MQCDPSPVASYQWLRLTPLPQCCSFVLLPTLGTVAWCASSVPCVVRAPDVSMALGRCTLMQNFSFGTDAKHVSVTGADKKTTARATTGPDVLTDTAVHIARFRLGYVSYLR